MSSSSFIEDGRLIGGPKTQTTDAKPNGGGGLSLGINFNSNLIFTSFLAMMARINLQICSVIFREIILKPTRHRPLPLWQNNANHITIINKYLIFQQTIKNEMWVWEIHWNWKAERGGLCSRIHNSFPWLWYDDYNYHLFFFGFIRRY